ncbi:MAG: hypothetical protein ABIO61_06010, partial [Thermomonas sp.]
VSPARALPASTSDSSNEENRVVSDFMAISRFWLGLGVIRKRGLRSGVHRLPIRLHQRHRPLPHPMTGV